MKIKITTKVSENYENVFQGFNEELFKKLAPPFPPFKLVQFDGCRTNDIVKIELNMILFKQNWISLITDSSKDSEEIYFIDEGLELPFFLKYWKHKHRIIKTKNGSKIIDDIIFTTPYKLLDYLIYPALYLQFLYRKPIYKKEFALK